MNPRKFLDLANRLAVGDDEEDWRSAVSRAYYAAFHVGRELLTAGGFAAPDGPQGHAYVWLRLANSGNRAVVEAGNQLNALRGQRNRADYDLKDEFDNLMAITQVGVAEDVVRLLDDLAATPAILDEVVAAIRVYERDVLRQVTSRGP